MAANSNSLRAGFTDTLQSMGGFEQAATCAVAVSGGSDSMALLLLLKHWTANCNASLIALTVNHGLRPEAAEEASWVAAQCKAHGIPHHTLTYDGTQPNSAIQEAARNIRYDLLTGWCTAQHILHLFMGHHAGDQAETLLFRAGRGSGLAGLAGMAAVARRNDVRILRPLLQYNKQELREFLEQSGQGWLEDPSNHNPVYSRTRLREFTQGNNTIKRCEKLTHSFQTIRNILEYKQASCLTQRVSIDPAGFAVLHMEPFSTSPAMLAESVLSSVLHTISGSEQPPRQSAVQQLYAELMQPSPLARRNLTGCLLQYNKKLHAYYVMREPAATAPPLPLQSGQWHYWDNRFMVYYEESGPATGPVRLAPLGDAITGLDKKALPPACKTLPATVLRTFPTLLRLEDVLCIPHIQYQNPRAGQLHCKLRFRPRKPLAGAPFFGMNNRHH